MGLILPPFQHRGEICLLQNNLLLNCLQPLQLSLEYLNDIFLILLTIDTYYRFDLRVLTFF